MHNTLMLGAGDRTCHTRNAHVGGGGGGQGREGIKVVHEGKGMRVHSHASSLMSHEKRGKVLAPPSNQLLPHTPRHMTQTHHARINARPGLHHSHDSAAAQVTRHHSAPLINSDHTSISWCHRHKGCVHRIVIRNGLGIAAFVRGSCGAHDVIYVLKGGQRREIEGGEETGCGDVEEEGVGGGQ